MGSPKEESTINQVEKHFSKILLNILKFKESLNFLEFHAVLAWNKAKFVNGRKTKAENQNSWAHFLVR